MIRARRSFLQRVTLTILIRTAKYETINASPNIQYTTRNCSLCCVCVRASENIAIAEIFNNNISDMIHSSQSQKKLIIVSIILNNLCTFAQFSIFNYTTFYLISFLLFVILSLRLERLVCTAKATEIEQSNVAGIP